MSNRANRRRRPGLARTCRRRGAPKDYSMPKDKKPVRLPAPSAGDAPAIPPHPDPTHRLPPEQPQNNGVAPKPTIQ